MLIKAKLKTQKNAIVPNLSHVGIYIVQQARLNDNPRAIITNKRSVITPNAKRTNATASIIIPFD
jgi:hypothetical protein